MNLSPIILATLNSRYSHSAFGLRYLYANMQELQGKTKILEFTINQDVREIAHALLDQNPTVIGLGVYIWNAQTSLELVEILKTLAPDIPIVLGGPEVSYEIESQKICELADYIVPGEGDLIFRELCQKILSGNPPDQKIIRHLLPDIQKISFPYDYYTQEDLDHRVLYVEASRGCPYKCEYCLSSLDKKVRAFDLDDFLASMDQLITRGARSFKFVDRTFNLKISTSAKILEFFLTRIHHGLFLHFELVPDRLPPELKMLIEKFPPGSLQFEIGIQTWNRQVAAHVSRRQDYDQTVANLKYLKSKTGIHLHTDLIAGLPGEDLESFAMGFDLLARLDPHEIQLGILKRLRGSPIIRHDQAFEMKYQTQAPYTVLSTSSMDRQTIQKLIRMAKYWDLIANSGQLPNTLQWLKKMADLHLKRSFFWLFWDLSNSLTLRHPASLHHQGISLKNLVQSIWEIYKNSNGADHLRAALRQDYCERVRREVPHFLRDNFLDPKKPASEFRKSDSPSIPERQLRHLQ